MKRSKTKRRREKVRGKDEVLTLSDEIRRVRRKLN